MALDLLASTSYVETPFIIIDIGGYKFGVYDRKDKDKVEAGYKQSSDIIYPNFVDNLSITKINGTLNTYNLKLIYAITAGDDPNLIDKILSTVKNTRTMKLTYGDLSIPSYIYKEEEALITKVTNNINVKSSCIEYNFTCISKALSLSAGLRPFGKKHAKPSEEIKDLLYDKSNGLLDIFYGMRDKNNYSKFVDQNDIEVDIEAKANISVLDYLKYLVSCMTSNQDKASSVVNNSNYALTIYDDFSNLYGGPYFKITEVTNLADEHNSPDIYQIDIGYPGQNIVTDFSVTDDETYSLLYDFSEKVEQSKYIYRIDNNGNMESIYSPMLTISSDLYKSTSSSKNWWTQVTQYPIKASLTIKGLLRPAILMTYIKINVWFYGRKHISSGTYIITEQRDSISRAGYRTTLSLVRIRGDESYGY